jgi:hypothetical protein
MTGPPSKRRTECRAHQVPVMRPWTLLPLDPTDTPACWTCAERSGTGPAGRAGGRPHPDAPGLHRSAEERRRPPRRTRLHRSTEERRRPRSTAFGLPPPSPVGPPEAACRQGEDGIEAARAGRSAPRPRCSGCSSPYSMRGAARLWAGCSTRCTVEVGSAAPGAVAGEHRSVAGWSARRGGRARPSSRLGAARCTDRAASASRPGRGRSSPGERGRHRTVECPRAATGALGVRWWTGERGARLTASAHERAVRRYRAPASRTTVCATSLLDHPVWTGCPGICH